MLDVISDGWQYLLDESAAQLLAFAIDVGIASAAEIYALERACAQCLSLVDLFETNRAVLTRDECFAWLEFMYGTVVNVERSLDNRSLGGKHNNLFVLVPERCTYAPRVAQGEGFSAASDATHDIATVPVAAARAQDVGYVNIVFDGVSQVESRLALS